MLPTDKQQRKQMPMARGLLDYFPDALAAVANVSFVGNEQHNPGEPMHWARGKSDDHADCLIRHVAERGTVDDDGLRHTAKVAWRALAMLQLELEQQASPDLVSPPQSDQEKAWVEAEAWARQQGWHKEKPYVYIAGPMRGLPNFNFPAFDKARDEYEARGFNPISPADLDRLAGDDTISPEDAEKPENQRRFVARDVAVLQGLRPENGDRVAVLPGWEKSRGASAEVFLGRWLGLRIEDAGTGEPLFHPDEDALNKSLIHYLESQEDG